VRVHLRSWRRSVHGPVHWDQQKLQVFIWRSFSFNDYNSGMVTLTFFLLQHKFVFTVFFDAFEKVCERYACTLTVGLDTYNICFIFITLLNSHMLHACHPYTESYKHGKTLTIFLSLLFPGWETVWCPTHRHQSSHSSRLWCLWRARQFGRKQTSTPRSQFTY